MRTSKLDKPDGGSRRGFWHDLTRPIFALAPMADVTDAAYRRLIAARGKPDVMFTEFVSADGLCSAGREHLLTALEYTDAERPIVAQIFGADPETMATAARLVASLGFDGVDINMGCPDRNVCKQGAGAALIKNPGLAREIIMAARSGAGDVPVSIKTRIGFTQIVTEEWMDTLLSARPAAITLHLRTRREMSKVDAHWEVLPKAVTMAAGTGTLILGNGDVADRNHGQSLIARTGCDGVMLGRAVLGNPWLFSRIRPVSQVKIEERLATMAEHAHLFERLFTGRKNFAIMRKYLRAYLAGFAGARQLRTKLELINRASDVDSVVAEIHEFLAQSSRDRSGEGFQESACA